MQQRVGGAAAANRGGEGGAHRVVGPGVALLVDHPERRLGKGVGWLLFGGVVALVPDAEEGLVVGRHLHRAGGHRTLGLELGRREQRAVEADAARRHAVGGVFPGQQELVAAPHRVGLHPVEGGHRGEGAVGGEHHALDVGAAALVLHVARPRDQPVVGCPRRRGMVLLVAAGLRCLDPRHHLDAADLGRNVVARDLAVGRARDHEGGEQAGTGRHGSRRTAAVGEGDDDSRLAPILAACALPCSCYSGPWSRQNCSAALLASRSLDSPGGPLRSAGQKCPPPSIL